MSRRDEILGQWENRAGVYYASSYLCGEEVDVFELKANCWGYRQIGSIMFQRQRQPDWLRFPSFLFTEEEVREVLALPLYCEIKQEG